MSKAKRSKQSWQERRNGIKHKWLIPLIFVEWLCERFSCLLSRWAFLEIMEYVGRLAILFAVVFYFMGSEDRRKAKHYQAWQVINTAQGKPVSGGRIDALHDLHEDGVSLVGVDLSKAYLRGVDLSGLVLSQADLSEADLSYADLSYADLSGAILSDANLCDANLSGARLRYAKFTGARLNKANLSGANFSKANLSGASFKEANLSLADVNEANLLGTDLRWANISDIVNWQKVSIIEVANIFKVKNAPDGFLEWAEGQNAVGIEKWDAWEEVKLEFLRKKADKDKK